MTFYFSGLIFDERSLLEVQVLCMKSQPCAFNIPIDAGTSRTCIASNMLDVHTLIVF